MTNTNRVTEITSAMPSFSKEYYHKSDLLPELLDLQKEMISLTFNDTHAEKAKLRIWDVKDHLVKLNEERGHVSDELLKTVKDGCNVICNAIRGEMSGNAGEFKAFRSIETIRCKKAVLKNVELTQGDRRTELDAVVLTEKAVFLVEVKNPSKDIYIDERGNYCRVGTTMQFDKNIGEKMNDKAFLLREVLTAAGIENPRIESLVVFTNTDINVENKFPYIHTCFLPALAHLIETYAGDRIYSESDLAYMSEIIEKAKCHESYPLPMDMNQFKLDFATLLATLEEAAEAQAEVTVEEETPVEIAEEQPCKQTSPWVKTAAVAAAAVALVAVPAVAFGLFKMCRK